MTWLDSPAANETACIVTAVNTRDGFVVRRPSETRGAMGGVCAETYSSVRYSSVRCSTPKICRLTARVLHCTALYLINNNLSVLSSLRCRVRPSTIHNSRRIHPLQLPVFCSPGHVCGSAAHSSSDLIPPTCSLQYVHDACTPLRHGPSRQLLTWAGNHTSKPSPRHMQTCRPTRMVQQGGSSSPTRVSTAAHACNSATMSRPARRSRPAASGTST